MSVFLVTWIFDADVNAQGGAYATGVLVLFTSAGAAVSLAARRAGQRRLSWAFAVITLVFVYTTVDNVIERDNREARETARMAPMKQAPIYTPSGRSMT